MLEDDEGEAAASRRSRSLNRRSSAAYKQRRTATRFSHVDAADQPTIEDQLADDLRRQTRSKPRREGRRSSLLIKDVGSENTEIFNKVGDGVAIGSNSVDPNSERRLTRSKARRSSINIGNSNGPTNERRKTFVKRQSELQVEPLSNQNQTEPLSNQVQQTRLNQIENSAALLETVVPEKANENRIENFGAVQELSSEDLLKSDSPHEVRELEITETATMTVETEKKHSCILF